MKFYPIIFIYFFNNTHKIILFFYTKNNIIEVIGLTNNDCFFEGKNLSSNTEEQGTILCQHVEDLFKPGFIYTASSDNNEDEDGKDLIFNEGDKIKITENAELDADRKGYWAKGIKYDVNSPNNGVGDKSSKFIEYTTLLCLTYLVNIANIPRKSAKGIGTIIDKNGTAHSMPILALYIEKGIQ